MTVRRRGENLAGPLAIHASSRADDWETPPAVFGPLHSEFGFTLDAAAESDNAKCPVYFTRIENALTQDWGHHIVWLNPPYGREISRWIEKAYRAALCGATVVCLVPSRTDTGWWHDYVMRGEVRLLRGRVRFERQGIPIGGSTRWCAPFPSAVVVFRPPGRAVAA